MEYTLEFIALILATFGLTFGLVNRDGAFQTMKKIRERYGTKSWSPFHCDYCTAVWVSLFFNILYFWGSGNFAIFIIFWWAVTGGSWIISAAFEWLRLDSGWEDKNRDGLEYGKALDVKLHYPKSPDSEIIGKKAEELDF